MFRIQPSSLWFCPLLLLALPQIHLCWGYIGTVSYYGPRYLPTACYGNDPSRLPADMLFAAAGAEIWNNGAGCGRIYHLKSDDGRIWKVKIVDYISTAPSYASDTDTTMALPRQTFEAITHSSALRKEIEILQ